MNETTKEALEGAIEKWQKIVDFLRYKRASTMSWVDYWNLDSLEQGRLNCPLCDLFMNSGCSKCPVENKTGNGCLGTPYSDYLWAKVFRVKIPAMRSAAKAELKFLKSLRRK